MKRWYIALLCGIIFWTAGCTFTFKGENVEAEGHVNKKYELQTWEVLVADSGD